MSLPPYQEEKLLKNLCLCLQGLFPTGARPLPLLVASSPPPSRPPPSARGVPRAVGPPRPRSLGHSELHGVERAGSRVWARNRREVFWRRVAPRVREVGAAPEKAEGKGEGTET